VDVRGFASTHVGRRANNEDAYLAARELGLYLVADGMGGYEGGEIASHLVVDSLQRFFERGAPREREAFADTCPDGGTPVEAMMEMAVRAAHREVEKRRHGRLAAMGSTVAAILLRSEHAVVAHVGDSRVYRLRGGSLAQITRDHSLHAQLVEAGVMAQGSMTNRNLITRAIGVPGCSKPDVATHRVRRGDAFLLCSDGLTDVLEDEEMEAILRELPPHRAVDALVSEAYVSGSQDNITALLVHTS